MSAAWVTIQANELAAVQLERCAEHLSRVADDASRVLDAVRCAHLAMVAGMTAALHDSAGIGALDDGSRKKALAALSERNGGRSFEERTMFYDGLLQAVQLALPWSAPLTLTSEEAAQAKALDGYRKLIDHPKPTTWTVSVEDLVGVIADMAPVVLRLDASVPQHRTADRTSRLHAACRTIEAVQLAWSGQTPA